MREGAVSAHVAGMPCRWVRGEGALTHGRALGERSVSGEAVLAHGWRRALERALPGALSGGAVRRDAAMSTIRSIPWNLVGDVS